VSGRRIRCGDEDWIGRRGGVMSEGVEKVGARAAGMGKDIVDLPLRGTWEISSFSVDFEPERKM